MCCLRYEHEFYVQQRKRFPKEGKLVRTARGEEKIIGNDIFRERVSLRGNDGEIRLLALEDLRSEMAAAGSLPLSLGTVHDEPDPVDPRVEVEDEAEIVAALDAIVADEPLPSESGASSPAPAQSNAAQAEASRKPHRRRGRRGGRRNRAGRDRGEPGNDSGGSAPPSA